MLPAHRSAFRRERVILEGGAQMPIPCREHCLGNHREVIRNDYKNAKKWSAERRGDALIAPEISTSSEHPELLHNILTGDSCP